MNIKSALERAHALQPTQKAKAADLYTNIEYELSYGMAGLGQEDYERAEDALAYLEEHFPGIRAQSNQRVVDGKHTPQLSRKANAELYKPQPGTDSEPAGGNGGTKTKTRVPEHARQHVARRRARYHAARAPRYTRQAGRTLVKIDQATTGGIGSTLWYGVLGAVGLSLLYLAVAGAGPKGLGNLFTGATNVLNWIVNPTTDPLRPPTGAVK